jgi:hypothetical protein
MEKMPFEKYILVNETFIVDHSISNNWAEWVSQNLLIALSDEKINNLLLSRILTDFNHDGESYALQYIVPESTFKAIPINSEIQQIRKKMFDIFKDKMASFQTQMEILEAKNMDLKIIE